MIIKYGRTCLSAREKIYGTLEIVPKNIDFRDSRLTGKVYITMYMMRILQKGDPLKINFTRIEQDHDRFLYDGYFWDKSWFYTSVSLSKLKDFK